jgi:hypothetical protein
MDGLLSEADASIEFALDRRTGAGESRPDV